MDESNGRYTHTHTDMRTRRERGGRDGSWVEERIGKG